MFAAPTVSFQERTGNREKSMESASGGERFSGGGRQWKPPVARPHLSSRAAVALSRGPLRPSRLASSRAAGQGRDRRGGRRRTLAARENIAPFSGLGRP